MREEIEEEGKRDKKLEVIVIVIMKMKRDEEIKNRIEIWR